MVFSDGTRQTADLVVYCTGYAVAMPFLDAEAMHAEMDGYERWLAKRFVASTRHTLEVDFDDYLRQLKRERQRGAKRAKALLPG